MRMCSQNALTGYKKWAYTMIKSLRLTFTLSTSVVTCFTKTSPTKIIINNHKCMISVTNWESVRVVKESNAMRKMLGFSVMLISFKNAGDSFLI